MNRLLLLFLFLIGYNGFANNNERAKQVKTERQPIADQGNGYYKNPILAGNYGDPTIIRVGVDYYMTHSQGRGYGLLLWHSRDLVNWQPHSIVPTGDYGSPWAPDLVYTHGAFYIYVTHVKYSDDGNRSFENYVYHAKSINGPWSGAINLNIRGYIDPGHLTDKNGNRYLYLDKGMVVELAKDGLSTNGELRKVYHGWDYPSTWVVECPCLESPKFTIKGDYYYLISAMGGTNGPSTAHMAIVARSKNPTGPWEESPFNPLVRNSSNSHKWWHQGHVTLIDDIEGSWWAVFHGRENGNLSVGRQTLLLPIEWNEQGWPVVSDDISPDDLIKKPAGEDIGNGMPLSDDFTSNELGIQWKVASQNWKNINAGNNKLTLKASGDKISNASTISLNPTNKSFEISVELEIPANGVEAGILIGNTGVGITNGVPAAMTEDEFNSDEYEYTLVLYNNGNIQRHRAGELPPIKSSRLFLKIINNNYDISLHYSYDNTEWHKIMRSFRTSSVYPALYAFGDGSVNFIGFNFNGF